MTNTIGPMLVTAAEWALNAATVLAWVAVLAMFASPVVGAWVLAVAVALLLTALAAASVWVIGYRWWGHD